MLLMILAAALLTAPSMEQASKDHCHDACSCSGPEDKVDVKCQDLPEGWWPTAFPENTNSLDLAGNPLHNVNAFSLQGKGLDNLTSLKLSNCRLSSIDLEAFKGLQRLTFLDLSLNNIKELKIEHFKDLESLQVIRLSGYERYQCKKLRTALKPKVTVLCDGHVAMSTTTGKASVHVDSSTESSVTPKRSTITQTTKVTTPSTETPLSTGTLIVASGGVDAGLVATVGVACFVVGALAMVLALVAARKLHWRCWGVGPGYEPADMDGENRADKV